MCLRRANRLSSYLSPNVKSLGRIRSLLAQQKVTSRQLVEEALAAINDRNGEGSRTFLRVYDEEALAAADRADAKLRSSSTAAPLCGIPISIKDLFDEAGVVTLAGSTVLIDSPPAKRDSTVVTRLKNAGAIIVGRTNMTEFAYSALGINPHYGTPKNKFDRAGGRIPGGSTSGGAISVADGMAAAAVGTDTGGSVRIPAALNGLVGFKPTARRVPGDGVFPLSTTLDSIGPIANNAADCLLLDAILTDEVSVTPVHELTGLTFAVPRSVVQEDLSPAVATAFETALKKLSGAGAKITEIAMKEFTRAAEVNPRGAISSYESWKLHAQWIRQRREQYDPRVLARILPGEAITDSAYRQILKARDVFVRDVSSAAEGYDALLMPTVPDTAPTIAEATKDDETYFRINGRMLRNPSIVNLFDGCALSVPCHHKGDAPVGLMIVGVQNADRHILSFGPAVAKVVFDAETGDDV
ncbi:MAG TPA: amidase [Gemmatimonadaceae bacterium]|nr:amidase [Gemmatimonadaceae bacterium]